MQAKNHGVILDVATGTGDLAFAAYKKLNPDIIIDWIFLTECWKWGGIK